jgi:hypothetical protein
VIEMGTWGSLTRGLYGPVLGGYSCLLHNTFVTVLDVSKFKFAIYRVISKFRLVLSFSQGEI